MAMTITDYKNWAVQNQQSTVALNRQGTGLEVAAKVSFIAKFFGVGAAYNARKSTMADFTRALSTRYGASIANEAISMARLSKDSELKGRHITSVLTNVKNLRAQMLRPGGEVQDIRLGNTEMPGEVAGDYLHDKNNAVTKFLKQRTVAVQLLGEMPLDQSEYENFHSRVRNLEDRLIALRNAAIPSTVPADDFHKALEDLFNAVNEKDAKMRELLAGKPLDESNIREYKGVWRKAAINFMETMRAAAAGRGDNPTASVLERAISLLRDNEQVRNDFNASIRLTKDVEGKCIKPFLVNLFDEAKRKLAAENVDVRGARIGTDNFVKKILSAFCQTLNERPWNVIGKTVTASIGGRPVELRSTIAPAAQLGHTAQSPRGPIAGNYPENVNGYMCHSATAAHAVNLAVSSLSVGDPGGGSAFAFSGVRHGVHCAWKISDNDERAVANANRAKEAVIAAFLAKCTAPVNPLQLPQPGQNGTITVNLKMTSVSLLTPDWVRNVFTKNSSSNERRMLVEQNDAWDFVARHGVEFEYNGQHIRIQPQILKFNFGVNAGAVSWPWLMRMTVSGGWDFSSTMNATAFAGLREQVEEFIQGNPDTKEAAAAQTLLDQCRQILDAKGERKDSHDAYKFAARVAVLSHLVGNMPCWNCKSGKDRTGQMDVECKFLSTLIARGEPIPAPGARLTESQKGLFRSIALEGGNFEIQKMNTGLSGFKTGGVDSIVERLGGKKYRNFHSGGSDFVKV